MKENCTHHPTKQAHFICPYCNLGFCSECITKRQKAFPLQNEVMHLCPKCNREADWVGVENIIDPFWKRFHIFFIYPFRLHPLIFIVVLSIIDAIFSGPSFFSLIIQIVLWGLLLKYAFSSLQATIEGDLIPPKISTKTISDDFFRVFKQIGIYGVIVVGFIFVGRSVGIIPAFLYLFVAILSVPAMIIVLVVTDRLFHAINPVVFIGLIFKVGWGYLLMYIFLILLAVAPSFCHTSLSNMLPPGLASFVANMAEGYYTIISYHLMGYVILQYHDRVGYHVDFENFRGYTDKGYDVKENKAIEKPNTEILNRVGALVKDGKLNDAITLIKDSTKVGGFTDLVLSERYFNLLKMEKRSAELLKHSKIHLNLLAKANQKTKACSIYAGCLSKDPAFIPSPLSLFKVAGWLNESGKSKAAISTFNKLIKAYPGDNLTPRAYFRSAQIFNDRLMQPEKATRILKGLIKKFPNHEIIPQVQNYISSMGI